MVAWSRFLLVVSSIALSILLTPFLVAPIGAQTDPRLMWVDTPVSGAVVGPDFEIAGFATDLRSRVDLIHVWLVPAFGGSPVFLGESTADGAHHTIDGAGFRLRARSAPSGLHFLAVYAWSQTDQTWSNQMVILVHVVGECRARIDAPVPAMSPGGVTTVPADRCAVIDPLSVGR